MNIKELDILGKPYKIYADYIEYEAIKQFIDCMKLPDVTRGSLMADAHSGYVLPIGGVIETTGTIYPSFVGYDIGCGITSYGVFDLDVKYVKDNAEKIRDDLYKIIPVGFNKNEGDQLKDSEFVYNESKWGSVFKNHELEHLIVPCLGTLGGGNHFLEIGYNTEDKVCITVHSGSRSFGHSLASFWMKIAQQENNSNKLESPNPLHIGSELGDNYFINVQNCRKMAEANRHLILDRVLNYFGVGGLGGYIINCDHNHCKIYKGTKIIHRKGAVDLEQNRTAVIPANMRDGCFIIERINGSTSKNQIESLNSCSHGAGRVLSRRKAKEQITLDMFKEEMKDIKGSSVSESNIDESPSAYKNIYKVLDDQSSIISVIDKIIPIVNIKG